MSIGAVTPYLVIDGAAAAIDWYREVFGAEEVARRRCATRSATSG